MSFLTRSVVAAAVIALLVPLVALGGGSAGRNDDHESRVLFATDSAGTCFERTSHGESGAARSR